MKLAEQEERLRRRIHAEFRRLGFSRRSGALSAPEFSKSGYRSIHQPQRAERLKSEHEFLRSRGLSLMKHFANGSEVVPHKISVRVQQIRHSTWESDLFRLANLLWSVPVSKGFGRRLRFLVWDDSNERLIGLFALGDPVFNLRVRDELIGWSSKDREGKLVNILDAYVLGAVPPYSNLLGGKLIACLVRTQEVVATFREQYRGSAGLISRMDKRPQLVLATTTSALGRSSVYNRLSLDGVKYFTSVGYTSGWGHFHVNETLFDEMRNYLKIKRDTYNDNYEFGDGPNWRMRAIKKTLALLNLNPHLAKHGYQREVFVSHIADNALGVLRGERKRARYESLRVAADVAGLALDRWMIPRAARDASFSDWTREDTRAQILSATASRSVMKTNQTQQDV